jgi:hypothetical protein
VDQKNHTQSAEKPPPQLNRYLQERRKDGPFTNLQEDRPEGDEDTAGIGSWAGK